MAVCGGGGRARPGQAPGGQLIARRQTRKLPRCVNVEISFLKCHPPGTRTTTTARKHASVRACVHVLINCRSDAAQCELRPRQTVWRCRPLCSLAFAMQLRHVRWQRVVAPGAPSQGGHLFCDFKCVRVLYALISQYHLHWAVAQKFGLIVLHAINTNMNCQCGVPLVA